MAMRNLSVEEMLTISDAWVTQDNAAHGALLGAPRLAPLIPDLTLAHGGILQVAPRPSDPRRDELTRLALEEDSRHDRVARGIYGSLTELSLLVNEGDKLIFLRDELMPEGVAKVTQTSFRNQAGYARLVEERLTPTMRSQLEAIPLPEGHMMERVQDWFGSAARLGALEEERARLEGPQGSSLAKQVSDARNLWVRTTNALLTMAELANLDETTTRLLFGPLRDAEAKADLRSARRSAARTQPTPIASEPGAATD